MHLRELFESFRLPITRGEIPRARGSYGAFVVSISTEDFLKLTTPNQAAIDSIKARPFPADREAYVNDYGDDKNFGKYNMPFLKVSFPDGKIFGHEGRHRAAMVARKGGDRIPVIIYPYEDTGYEVTYKYWDESGYRQERTLTGFSDEESAHRAGEEALRAFPEDDRGRIKTHWSGNRILRGEQSRSNPEDWCYAAWKKEDFPKVLRGQYTDYETSDFRVGIVKGYHHHRC